MRTLRCSGVLLTAVLMLAGCATEETVETTSSTGPTTTAILATTTILRPETTTTIPPGPSTTAPPTTTTIPGEPIDFGPRTGDVLMVVGVSFDDVLNLRALPGPDQPVVATLAPDYADVVAKGETRQIPGALWVAVTVDSTDGWVNLRYLGYEGPTDDLTASVVEVLGEYPTAPTMAELGRVVAGSMASDEPESDVVVVVEERVGDLGEVTYDVIGLGGDSILGLRAHVFGEPVSDGFSLRTVEVTTICGRGITPEGLCA
jgi:hypothetical protein